MGIYDREYYRDETRGSGWLSGVAPVCKALIAINVAVFFGTLFFPQLLKSFEAYSPLIFERFQVYRLLSAAFLHDIHSPFHIFLNMLALWYFGREMESMYGSRDFLWMYLTAAILSSLAWSIVSYFGPDHGHAPMLGASGAVWAVAVLYTLYYPRREILLFFVFPLEMWIVLILFLGADLISLIQIIQGNPGAGFGTAVASHLGGALYGYLYKRFDLRWSRLSWPTRRRRPRLRVVKADTPYLRDADLPVSSGSATRSMAASQAARPTQSAVASQEQLDAKLDEVLAKIAREGRGGLTDEENRVLQEASRRARDRRSDRF
jgi:membrane associated rhomboid family serine protease